MATVLSAVLILVNCREDGELEPGGSICDSCALELRPLATLDFEDAPFSPSMFVNVERLSDGTFAVADWARGLPEILHFSATGSYIDSHMREGEGPGEALAPQTLLAMGDSLWVLDNALARCTLLDGEFEYVRSFPCTGSPMDGALVDGALMLTGFGPMDLVEYDAATGERSSVRSYGSRVPVSDDYATLAAASGGVWYVAHPNQYSLTFWRPGEDEPSRTIERTPEWWHPGELFLMDRGPNGRPVRNAPERQVMRGPLVFGIGTSDGLVWTASYVYTSAERQYSDFLDDWLGQGLQGDVRVFIEALRPEGELVAAASFEDMAPPKFTSGGLLYALTREGDGTGVSVYQPSVVRRTP